ncbi:50S ribosomal protein L21 [Erythrobacter sp. HL-111]|uniref:50S ribosomal protein L21 n=1 Tax=Erythrobacter sp. HL-111 TaxID=1798193 RepID=UPI0006D970AE|nr:MAG: LSU ribosomal protein L21 RplU [Erythrobacteraceae bacterium HL-111]SDR71980.1 large subunit ribosomal protein L21 [Erythrobacter sp. HL-111]
MFAIVRTGGKQYRVAAGDKIAVEKLAGEAGDTITLGDVLLAGEGDSLADASKVTVSAEIIAQAKSEKVIVFKKRRRHNYRRKNGHRQQMTLLRITDVGTGGAKKAAARKDAAPKAETKGAETKGTDTAGTDTKSDRDTGNLSLISGIGPTIEKKLREAGINSWEDIAGWDEATANKWNDELKLGNRPIKDEWAVQAQELLDGKPPRAKVDQAEAASGEDK